MDYLDNQPSSQGFLPQPTITTIIIHCRYTVRNAPNKTYNHYKCSYQNHQRRSSHNDILHIDDITDLCSCSIYNFKIYVQAFQHPAGIVGSAVAGISNQHNCVAYNSHGYRQNLSRTQLYQDPP
jgi:hypothetical protein